jgi:hypothetical protein
MKRGDEKYFGHQMALKEVIKKVSTTPCMSLIIHLA